MALTPFQEAAREHAKRLDNLIERGSVPRLRKLYQSAADELEAQLARSLRSGASPFTINQQMTLLAQARQALAKIAGQMGNELGDSVRKTQEASARGLIKDIKRMQKAATGGTLSLPIEQASRFAGVVDRRRTSLLKLNRSSMAKYGASVVAKLEQTLANALVTGVTGHAAIDKVREAVDMEWWRAERIVRTETAWAYNATQRDATEETVKALPDMRMRWVEMVTDVTLTKLDERVGEDSVAMHGQLAAMGQVFQMPPVHPHGLPLSPSLMGKYWEHPPNRPNDRAVVQPWRPGWGWGWELVNGRRVVR